MKHVRMFAIMAMASALGMLGCSKPEGVYTLDKEQTKKAWQANPPKKSGQAPTEEDLSNFLDQLEARLELEPGGTVTMTAKLFGHEGEPRKGSWKAESGAILLDLDGDPMKCVKDGSKKLTCGDADKDEMSGMVFVKSPN